MNRVGAFFGGTQAFFTGLFRRTSKTKGRSGHGHLIMDGWTAVPEEKIIRGQEIATQKGRKPARVALYGIHGPHAGECFALGKSVELLGREADCSVVLTPLDATQGGRCRLFINGVVRMLAETGSYFKINNVETEQAELFDYDEIECLGNRFLVLVSPQNEGRSKQS